MTASNQRGASVVELVIFVAAVVMPFAGFLFWLMDALLKWFHSMDAVVSGPF